MAPDSRNHERNTEQPTVKKPVEARAGLVSGHVIVVLIVGTILAMTLLGIAWAVIG